MGHTIALWWTSPRADVTDTIIFIVPNLSGFRSKVNVVKNKKSNPCSFGGATPVESESEILGSLWCGERRQTGGTEINTCSRTWTNGIQYISVFVCVWIERFQCLEASSLALEIIIVAAAGAVIVHPVVAIVSATATAAAGIEGIAKTLVNSAAATSASELLLHIAVVEA